MEYFYIRCGFRLQKPEPVTHFLRRPCVNSWDRKAGRWWAGIKLSVSENMKNELYSIMINIYSASMLKYSSWGL